MTNTPKAETIDVGLPKIDEQHKELINISNGLLQAMVNGMGHDVLEEIFGELVAYTEYHFSDEEKYMEEIGYPGIDEQKACHAKLTQDVKDFSEKILGGDPVLPNEALDFINHWIVQHIKEMDTKIEEFVGSKG